MKSLIVVAFFAAFASAVPLDFQPSLNFDHPALSGETGSLRIVGGEEVPPHAVPYQAGLFMGNAFCGGSLINSRYVLTTAHCALLGARPTVVLGAHRINQKEPEQVSLVAAKVIVHPHYDSQKFLNDIALIMLPQDVRFTNAIQPIKLAPPNAGFFENQQARVTGWGVTSDQNPNLSPVLRYALNPIMPNNVCERKLSGVRITNSHLCLSGDNRRSPCKGDAGAPVITEYQRELVQVGIVSFMMENACEKGYPVGLTRVSYYYNWITSNM